jgi:hypothetical protein
MLNQSTPLRRSTSESPLNLALCRIAVAALVLRTEELWQAQDYARAATQLRTPAEGLNWAVALLPLSESLVTAFQGLTLLAAVLSLLGLFTRVALATLALGTLALFALPQFTGSPRHSMHVVWFVFVLALSPAGRALSLDLLISRFRGQQKPFTHAERWGTTTALWTMRALLAVIYFFPGLWKLLESGFDWALSDNLQNQMYWKWAQFGAVPEFRPDHYPGLIRVSAIGVLLLELGFPLLMWSRPTRLVAAVLGLAFHQAATATMYIGFSSLWWCYVVLVDWAGLFRWFKRGRGGRGSWLTTKGTSLRRLARGALKSWSVRVALGAQLLLVFLCLCQGARGQMRAYPFACYPTFQWRAPARMPDLRIVLLSDGQERTLADGPASLGVRSQYRWGAAWQVMGIYDGVVEPARLRAYLEGRLDAEPKLRTELLGKRVTQARFYRVDIDVRPGHWHDPAPTQLLAELPFR